MIKKLENIIVREQVITGQYSDNNGTHYMYSDHYESSARLPNNEEIMEKINEIIDYLNKEVV